jgi:hypothetical protein
MGGGRRARRPKPADMPDSDCTSCRLIASELHGSGDMQFLAKGVLCIIEIPSGEALIQDE